MEDYIESFQLVVIITSYDLHSEHGIEFIVYICGRNVVALAVYLIHSMQT